MMTRIRNDYQPGIRCDARVASDVIRPGDVNIASDEQYRHFDRFEERCRIILAQRARGFERAGAVHVVRNVEH